MTAKRREGEMLRRKGNKYLFPPDGTDYTEIFRRFSMTKRKQIVRENWLHAVNR